MPDSLAHDLRGLLQRAMGHLDVHELKHHDAHTDAIRTALTNMSSMLAEAAAEDVDLRPLCEAAAASAPLPTTVEGDAAAYADRGAVLRVLGNLLENAARHASAATVTLHDAPVRIRITDDGPGLSRHDAFEAGVSGDGGTGMGLANSRNLARSMGGDLEWDEGGFTLSLPSPKKNPK